MCTKAHQNTAKHAPAVIRALDNLSVSENKKAWLMQHQTQPNKANTVRHVLNTALKQLFLSHLLVSVCWIQSLIHLYQVWNCCSQALSQWVASHPCPCLHGASSPSQSAATLGNWSDPGLSGCLTHTSTLSVFGQQLMQEMHRGGTSRHVQAQSLNDRQM